LKEPNVQIAFEPPTHPPKPGIRVFPAPIKGTFVKRLARSRTQAASAEIEESKLEGFLPAHLALNPQKPLMDKRLKRGKFFDPITKLKRASTWRRQSFRPISATCFRTRPFLGARRGKSTPAGDMGAAC
jgi:hypothetical protein